MGDDFRYTEEDEDKLVEIAKQINLPLIGFASIYRRASPTLEFTLCHARDSTREYLEEFAEEDEDLEILAPGNELFRRYDEIKDLAAISVIVAEAAVAAADYGYVFRMLTPDEIDPARLAVEDLDSYVALRKERTQGQIKAYEELQKMDKSKLSPGFLEKLEEKIKRAGITQAPAGVFEIHPRVSEKQYLVFVLQSRIPSAFHIFSREKRTVLDELRFYDPNLGEDETRFHAQFRQ